MHSLFRSFRIMVIINAVIGLILIAPHIFMAVWLKDQEYAFYSFIPVHIMAGIFYFNAILYIASGVNLLFIFNEFLDRERNFNVVFSASLFAANTIVFLCQLIYIVFMNTNIF